MPSSTSAVTPLISTVSPMKPLRTSPTRPATSVVAVVISSPSAGKSMNTFGAWVSLVTVVLVTGLVVPSPSTLRKEIRLT